MCALEHSRHMHIQVIVHLEGAQTKHLIAHEQSVENKSLDKAWGPPELEPPVQMALNIMCNEVPLEPLNQKYGLGAAPKTSNMVILKRSEMWIADSGASNHAPSVTLYVSTGRMPGTGSTHGIVGKSVACGKLTYHTHIVIE